MSALNQTLTLGGVVYPISDESWSENNFGKMDQSITWTFKCFWTDRVAIRAKILGGAFISGGIVSLAAPMAHPTYNAMLATRVNAEMAYGSRGKYLDTTNGNTVGSDYATMQVSFEAHELDTGNESVEYSARYITCPNGMFKFKSDTSNTPLLSAEMPAILVPRVSLKMTNNYVASLPVAAILSIIGKVNNAPFLGADTEWALYLGASASRQFSTIGTKFWTLTQNILSDAKGWNNFLNPKKPGSWDRLVNVADGSAPYNSADFSVLGMDKSGNIFGTSTFPGAGISGGISGSTFSYQSLNPYGSGL